MQGWIDANSVVSLEQLGVHCAHGRANDEIRGFLCGEIFKERERLGGHDRDVWGYDGDSVILVEIVSECDCGACASGA